MVENWKWDYEKYAIEHEHFVDNLRRWIKEGDTKEDLCFVLIEDSIVKGGIIFSSHIDNDEIGIMDFSLSLDSFNLGAEFINKSLEGFSNKSIHYHLYNDNDEYDYYKKCFIDAGFLVFQEKLSYRFCKKDVENRKYRLDFRSYEDVGEANFLQAISLVTKGTLDKFLKRSVENVGINEAVRIYVEELKTIDFQKDIWVLAFNNDELIGLVIPSNFGRGYGGINYIGVIPQERGKGYVDDLLIKGTQLLLNQGVSIIIADIDIDNFPMKDALIRCEYEFFYDLVILEKRV